MLTQECGACFSMTQRQTMSCLRSAGTERERERGEREREREAEAAVVAADERSIEV
jgi:hypothetical protein